jgi:hypothetical protein
MWKTDDMSPGSAMKRGTTRQTPGFSNGLERVVMVSQPASLSLSRKILRALIALNWVYGFGVLLLLIASVVAPSAVFNALGFKTDGANGMLIPGARLVMVLGILAVPITNVVLTRLLAIVDTVRHGDPFIVENAKRLQTIAWAVVGLEMLHLAIGIIAAVISTSDAPFDINWSFSLTRWIAVLLLFVLARVFEQGARMREDLEGTI